MNALRVGLIGAGANTRDRHVPGLRAVPGVELVAVCNRRPASTERAAREFGVPRTFARWQDLVADPDVDAVVVGTWPYLHAPITLACLEAGKHVLCEARMAMNAAEAREMLAAARRRPEVVAQLVPSPFGLAGDATVRRLLEDGFVGTLREVRVAGLNGALADPASPLSWRQDAALSGVNALAVGILYETVTRWVPPAVRLTARSHAFVSDRFDPESGTRRPVGTPDSVQALAVLADGSRAVFDFSGAVPAGGEMSVRLYGTDGFLHYDLAADRLTGTTRRGGGFGPPEAIPFPPEEAGGWRAEADFVASAREGKPVGYTDFEAGVRYMAFTEAVARAAETGRTAEV